MPRIVGVLLSAVMLAAGAQVGSAQAAYPLQVSENHRYLVDHNDKPFLIVGDTPQGLMGRLTEQDAEYYFADREAHGFNTLGWIDVECAGRDYPANKDAATPDGTSPFTGYVSDGTDYTHYDLSKPNEAYFVRLDHIVQLAAKHHLFVFLDPMETIGWLPTLRSNGMKAAFAYGQFLGNGTSVSPTWPGSTAMTSTCGRCRMMTVWYRKSLKGSGLWRRNNCKRWSYMCGPARPLTIHGGFR